MINPTQVYKLGRPQTVAEGDKDHGGIPVTMADMNIDPSPPSQPRLFNPTGKRPPTHAPLLRLRCNAIASVATKHFD